MSITIKEDNYYYMLLEELAEANHKHLTAEYKTKTFDPPKPEPDDVLHMAIIEYAIKNYPEAITAANQRVLDDTPDLVKVMSRIFLKDGEN